VVGHGQPSEFRLDPLTEEWVTIVGGRQRRPNRPSGDCPFCVGGLEAPDPYVVRAFENRWPPLRPGPPPEALVSDGFTSMPAVGAAEVVLYSPDHGASLASLGGEGIRRVVDLWAERTEALLARPEIEYVLVFENRGAEAGATIDHPHGQIYAFPFVPPVPLRESTVAERRGCTVCAQVLHERAAGARVVADAEGWVAYVPYASGWPYGLLLAPDEHVDGLPELADAGRAGLTSMLGDVLGRYDRLFDRAFPYMLWIHHGVHLHVHLAPPLRARETMRYVASGEVGSGTLSNPVVPEDAAAALRAA
jgi:UDPglucose--hexose-1-phosphate uridylyltransferase